MKKKNIKYIKYVIYILLILISNNNKALAQEITIKGDYEKGEKIFKKECTSCHSINLKTKLIGPELFEITKKREISWLTKWITNNSKLRKSGDKLALKIYKDYNNIEMNNFEYLKQEDINNLLFFIDSWQEKDNHTQNTNQYNNQINKKINQINQDYYILKKTITLGMICLSVILSIILFKIYKLLNLININTLEEYKFFKNQNSRYKYFLLNICKYIINNKKITFTCITLLVFLNIYTIWTYLMNIDINKGYKPEQPIYFSHKIHAKINQINCQYCHYNAKYSKNADIPSLKLCMNCHNTIKEYKGTYIEKNKNKKFYNKEINKIYRYIGWDKNTNKYINKTKPIEWIRVHNMPDFVHFNHYQHIILGKDNIIKQLKVNKTCQACHGTVENMDEIKMVNDFSMKWCIQCHKVIKINQNNKYYQKYYQNIKNNKITVEKLGGTECNKCHY